MNPPEPTSKGEAASEQWLADLLPQLKSIQLPRVKGRISLGGRLEDRDIIAIAKFIRQRDTQLIAKLRELGPKKRNEYYGMGDCGDFSHCIPGYIDVESVEWWNEVIDAYETLFQQIERGEI
jgi:hypothetical protein